MKAAGPSTPCSGWRQRAKVSRPFTWPVASSILGWKKGSNWRCCRPTPTSAKLNAGEATPRAARRRLVVVEQRLQLGAGDRLGDGAQQVDAIGLGQGLDREQHAGRLGADHDQAHLGLERGDRAQQLQAVHAAQGQVDDGDVHFRREAGLQGAQRGGRPARR
jgi:hypothetical protein